VFFTWLRGRLSVDNPGGTQQCMEALLTNSMGVGVRDLLEDIAGHGAAKYLPMLGSIGMFVLMSNLISLVPGFSSPTAQNSVPLGCAVVVFLYYNWCGIVHHGPLGYGKQFLGPSLALAPIMLPIEIVSNLARLLSLTVRLWVNMVVSELLYATFLGLTLALVLFAGKLNAFGYALAPVPLLVCPLLHWIVHEMKSASGSLMGMLQVKCKGFPVELLEGDGMPNTGGVLALVVKLHTGPVVDAPWLSQETIFQW
jgi:F0F1-type ATP synthase membrane subunit a